MKKTSLVMTSRAKKWNSITLPVLVITLIMEQQQNHKQENQGYRMEHLKHVPVLLF